MLNTEVLDTRFRSALARLAHRGRILTYEKPADPHLEIAAMLKKHDGQQALLFPSVKGTEVPVVGNLLSSRENCEAGFGLDFRGIRGLVQRALGGPLPPQLVNDVPVQEVVLRTGFDITRIIPALFHAPGDAGRYITAGIVVVKDPVTGIYNASYHRLQLLGPDRVGHQARFRPSSAARLRARQGAGQVIAGRGVHRYGSGAAFHRGHHGLADA